jgi:hypothetical protein
MDSLTILIIRHAEKAGEAWPGPGLTPDGIEDKQSLVIRGWQRAGGWGALFATGLGGLDYPKPSVIYAADPNARAIDEPSQRPFQTIIPLATRLGLTPVTDFAVGAETELATSITAQAGVVLVAWEHKAITRSLLPAIAKDQALVNMPTKWDETRFDVVLRFDRTSAEGPWSMCQLFPCLLSGDSTNPMA